MTSAIAQYLPMDIARLAKGTYEKLLEVILKFSGIKREDLPEFPFWNYKERQDYYDNLDKNIKT